MSMQRQLWMWRQLTRIALVLFLIYPSPVLAEETTVTEDFDNQQINQDITFVYGSSDTAVAAETDCNNSQAPGGIHIEDMDCHGGNPYFGSDRYQLGIRSSTDSVTIAFPNSDSKQITEVGFITMAVDEVITATVYYDNSTSATFNIAVNSGNTPTQISLSAPTNTTINEVQIPGASDNLQDWWLIDDIYYKHNSSETTTTTTTSTTSTTTTTTTTSTTTTTTTIPPEPEEVYEPPPPPPPPLVTVIVGGEEVEYEEYEVEDGTVERDQERVANLENYGCELTDAQIARGDCDIEIYEEEYEEEIYEEIYEEGEELLDDSIIILEISDDDGIEIIEVIELTEEEIIEIEKEMEIEAKELELLDGELEFLEDFSEEELEEYVEVILEIEEYIDDIEVFETEIIIIEEDINLIDIFIANDLFPPDPEDIEKDLESIQDDIIKEEEIEDENILNNEEEIFTDDTVFLQEEELPDEEILDREMAEEKIAEEVAELKEVIEEIIIVDIPEATEEEIEEFTEEELVEYEEAKEEAIQEFVQELETEEVIEIIEEVNDIGIENLDKVDEKVIEVIAQVVEEVIEIAQEEEITEEQAEAVAEVLGFEETEDVEIIAEAVKTDENAAQAVDEFVERAVEFAKTNSDQEYTLADAQTEVSFENFIESPISAITDINIQDVNIRDIGNDMTEDAKQKSQEVVVPVILARIATLASFVTRKLG